jgi:hypothetical protein
MANELEELDEADKDDVSNKANKSDKAVEANVADRANLANKADKASLAKANKLLTNDNIAIVIIKYSSKLLLHDGDAIDLFLYFSFSPTKYIPIFAEVKGYFVIVEIGL